MKHQILIFFTCICCFFIKTPLHALDNFKDYHDTRNTPSQRQPSNAWENIQLKIRDLTKKIEFTSPSDIHKSDALFIDRGILFLFCGEYEDAINDFNHPLLASHNNNGYHSEKNFGRALWGRILSYAFLGKSDEFHEDLNNFADLIGFHKDCKCPRTTKTLHSTQSSEKFTLSTLQCNLNRKDDIMLCDAFCENTVDNTVKFMKAMLNLFIDGLGDKAKRCCRGNGFWRDCVDPMVEVANKWKIFGIPNDPYFD